MVQYKKRMAELIWQARFDENGIRKRMPFLYLRKS